MDIADVISMYLFETATVRKAARSRDDAGADVVEYGDPMQVPCNVTVKGIGAGEEHGGIETTAEAALLCPLGTLMIGDLVSVRGKTWHVTDTVDGRFLQLARLEA